MEIVSFSLESVRLFSLFLMGQKKKNFLVSLFHCLTGKLIPYLNKVSTYFVPDTATLLGTFIHTLRLGGETIPYVSPPLVEKAKLLGVG